MASLVWTLGSQPFQRERDLGTLCLAGADTANASVVRFAKKGPIRLLVSVSEQQPTSAVCKQPRWQPRVCGMWLMLDLEL